MLNVTLVAIAALVISAAGTWRMRRYAMRRRLLDVPNSRSSHDVPTPRGGGAGLVAAILVAFGVGQWFAAPLTIGALLPLAGLLLVSAIGWQDDRASIGVFPRLTCHALAALTLLPLVLTPEPTPQVWWPVAAVAWVFLGISAINVVNFMDGIDGFVGSQGLVFGAHLAVLGGLGPAALFGAALAGASAGFLIWNWAPARIFLGDVGSGALGLSMVFGGALVARHAGASLIVIFLPLYPMFLDATVTLVRRALRGERVIDAHRSHLYQVLANGGWGHPRVTALYALAAALGFGVASAHTTPHWDVAAAVYVALVSGGFAWLSTATRSRAA